MARIKCIPSDPWREHNKRDLRIFAAVVAGALLFLLLIWAAVGHNHTTYVPVPGKCVTPTTIRHLVTTTLGTLPRTR